MHYHKPGLFEEILAQLVAAEIRPEQATRKDISGVDEFHVRGAQVSKELAKTIELEGRRLLDVGCGIGGPCRMLADEFNCMVTGIDLSHEFIRTANQLSVLLGMEKKTKFLQGNATNLPFADASFDVVWTQHVQMNIEDKNKFYSEIDRVLAKGGSFIYYDIFKGKNTSLNFPVPWADEPAISFLTDAEKVQEILTKLKLEMVLKTDQTKAGIEFFEELLNRKQKQKRSKLGLNVLMGESGKTKLLNVLEGLKKECLVLESCVYRKKAS